MGVSRRAGVDAAVGMVSQYFGVGKSFPKWLCTSGDRVNDTFIPKLRIASVFDDRRPRIVSEGSQSFLWVLILAQGK